MHISAPAAFVLQAPMLLVKLLLLSRLAFAGPALIPQTDIDEAYGLILSTQAGQAICTHILGADPDALEAHLGVSAAAAKSLAAKCNPVAVPDWIYATSPADIRKLTVKPAQFRKYGLIQSQNLYPIESWTDNFTNTTIILNEKAQLSRGRLVQILAHELAVYFDSKATPAHPEARHLPQLANLQLDSDSRMNPLLALSDPLNAHTLTFVRALAIERLILGELLTREQIEPPEDAGDEYLSHLLSPSCARLCLENLVVDMRKAYEPLSLPLLAFAPFFRNLALAQLPQDGLDWTQLQWRRAREALVQMPVDFLKNNGSSDPLSIVQQLLSLPLLAPATDLHEFLAEDLWPYEWNALDKARLESGEPLLEFMKKPLLSGYNIMLSSGPRVRVRTGNTE